MIGNKDCPQAGLMVVMGTLIMESRRHTEDKSCSRPDKVHDDSHFIAFRLVLSGLFASSSNSDRRRKNVQHRC